VDEKPTTTRGIQSAQKGALAVLQHATRHTDTLRGSTSRGSHTFTEIEEAAREIATQHAPTADQPVRYDVLAKALQIFLIAIVENTDPGPERSAAINYARTAKFWASAAVALEGK
jgi:hypothetical protein